MFTMRQGMRAIATLVLLVGSVGSATAEDWGRYYHYPYSYFPQNFRAPYRSQDFNSPVGISMHPQYMAFPPYFRRDLYYPYLNFRKPGNNPKYYYQGNHFTLDVF